MEVKKQSRKRRQDSNHAVYSITNLVTGEYYIGITVCSGSIKQALKVRFQKHIRRAVTENKSWALCNSIREFGSDVHVVEFVEKIRGRKPAHARERELIREYGPALNTH
jgi:hypothetical protein